MLYTPTPIILPAVNVGFKILILLYNNIYLNTQMEHSSPNKHKKELKNKIEINIR